MSILTRPEIKNFLLTRKGYIKKSPLNIAKAMWKISPKTSNKSNDDIRKDFSNIQSVLKEVRAEKDVQLDSNIVDIYNNVINNKNKPIRRLFFDIETSPNIGFFWQPGRKVSIDYTAIIEERATICICYKWEDEAEVHSMEWDGNFNDKRLLERFSKIISQADEVVTQNGDKYDIPWLRSRCMIHDIPFPTKINSYDTLKIARSQHRMNSNRLDYMGKFMGEGEKMKTDFGLWKDIVLKNDKRAMEVMVDYCKQDVSLLEKVYKKLQKYTPKKFKYKRS